jgi:transposase
MRHIDKAVSYISPSETVRELKALLLYRRKLEQEKTSKKVRVAELKSTAAKSRSVSFILRDAQKSIRVLEKSIKDCEKQILALYDSDEELKKSYDHLISIRGIGIVNATAMIAYSNNFKNITSSRKLASYYGIAPFRERSGTTIDKKAMVKCYSSSMLRAYLTQAAENTIREHGIYHDYYTRLSARGKCHGIALNNVKNKLLHLSLSLITNDMDYEENHEVLRAIRKVQAG